MKELKQTIKESNLEKLQAFKMMKSNSSIGAKDFVGKVFKIKGYVVTNNEILDIETGEITKSESICFLTETDEIIGSNSSSLLRTFYEIMEIFENWSDIDVVITRGTSKKGNTFLSLEVA